jgi:hypothetical protein
VDKEEVEADLQFAKIEEYIDGKRKRDEKVQVKKIEKIAINLNKQEFKRDFG